MDRQCASVSGAHPSRRIGRSEMTLDGNGSEASRTGEVLGGCTGTPDGTNRANVGDPAIPVLRGGPAAHGEDGVPVSGQRVVVFGLAPRPLAAGYGLAYEHVLDAIREDDPTR